MENFIFCAVLIKLIHLLEHNRSQQIWKYQRQIYEVRIIEIWIENQHVFGKQLFKYSIFSG